MKSRDYRDYLHDILEAIVDIESFISNFSYEDFIHDKKTVNAVIRSIEVIGEAAKNIPDTVKTEYSVLPWKRMTGMRDKLIHGYFGVDTKTLYKAAKEDIPPLKASIEKMLKEQEKP
jgi:uncharacterized protein with HEPN domain